jgi:hypothetical protein
LALSRARPCRRIGLIVGHGRCPALICGLILDVGFFILIEKPKTTPFFYFARNFPDLRRSRGCVAAFSGLLQLSGHRRRLQRRDAHISKEGLQIPVRLKLDEEEFVRRRAALECRSISSVLRLLVQAAMRAEQQQQQPNLVA